MKDKHGNLLDRISPWAKYVVQPPESEGYTYKYIFYNPDKVILNYIEEVLYL